MSLETMIRSLSREEKITAMDLIWQDLMREPQSFMSPKWHERVVAARLKSPASGQALPLTEAKVEIKEAINASRTPC